MKTAETTADAATKDKGIEATGTSDVVYDLVSVLYHSLQGAATYARYHEDAEKAGDQDMASFFRDATEGNKQRAERAKLLLARRLAGQAGFREKDAVDTSLKGSFPASDPPAHR